MCYFVSLVVLHKPVAVLSYSCRLPVAFLSPSCRQKTRCRSPVALLLLSCCSPVAFCCRFPVAFLSPLDLSPSCRLPFASLSLILSLCLVSCCFPVVSLSPPCRRPVASLLPSCRTSPVAFLLPACRFLSLPCRFPATFLLLSCRHPVVFLSPHCRLPVAPCRILMSPASCGPNLMFQCHLSKNAFRTYISQTKHGYEETRIKTKSVIQPNLFTLPQEQIEFSGEQFSCNYSRGPK